MTRVLMLIACACLFALAAMSAAVFMAHPASAQPVASIDWHDGDSGTIDGKPFRLADVDAPETGGVGSRGGAKCEAERELGKAARDWIIAATRGRKIVVTTIRTKDDYGRSVVTLSADGQDVGKLGLAAGQYQPWVFRGQRATTKKPLWC